MANVGQKTFYDFQEFKTSQDLKHDKILNTDRKEQLRTLETEKMEVSDESDAIEKIKDSPQIK